MSDDAEQQPDEAADSGVDSGVDSGAGSQAAPPAEQGPRRFAPARPWAQGATRPAPPQLPIDSSASPAGRDGAGAMRPWERRPLTPPVPPPATGQDAADAARRGLGSARPWDQSDREPAEPGESAPPDDSEPMYPWQRRDVDFDLKGAATWDPSDYPDDDDESGIKARSKKAAGWLFARRDDAEPQFDREPDEPQAGPTKPSATPPTAPTNGAQPHPRPAAVPTPMSTVQPIPLSDVPPAESSDGAPKPDASRPRPRPAAATQPAPAPEPEPTAQPTPTAKPGREPEPTTEPEPTVRPTPAAERSPAAGPGPDDEPAPAPRPRPRPATAAAPTVVAPESPAASETRPPLAEGPDLTKFLAASEPQPGDDEKEPKERKPRKPNPVLRVVRGSGRRIVRYVIVIGIVVGVALLLRAFVVSPVYIPSASMEPTLHGCDNCNDDYVLVDKVSYRLHDPRRQDIVVFDRPANFAGTDDVLIKRVIATGGQTVTLRGGQVFVDNLKLSEPYVNKACGPNPTRPLTGRSSWKIPDGSLFVMGDNRCNSEDGRAFGPIPVSSVIGRAWLIFWPINRFGTVG